MKIFLKNPKISNNIYCHIWPVDLLFLDPSRWCVPYFAYRHTVVLCSVVHGRRRWAYTSYSYYLCYYLASLSVSHLLFSLVLSRWDNFMNRDDVCEKAAVPGTIQRAKDSIMWAPRARSWLRFIWQITGRRGRERVPRDNHDDGNGNDSASTSLSKCFYFIRRDCRASLARSVGIE